MADESHPWDKPTREVLPPVETGWTPKFEFGLPSDRPLESAPATDTEEWTHAPSSSHISRFLYRDARTNSLTRKFGRVLETPAGGNPYARGASELRVVFRNEKSGGESAEYAYFYEDAAAGASIFDLMRGSGHPYGEVLHPLVIKGGVPYQRISRM
jgi:hypothetical protein